MTVRAWTDDGIAHVVLEHPPVNVLTRQVLALVRAELERLARDPALRVLLLAAEGRHFSAGADVAEHLPPLYRDLIPEFLETVRAVSAFPVPVVAAVRGKCLGGGFELVQAADLVVAGEGASFGQPEILLGVLPPAACAFLPHLCPHQVCAELVLTGDPIDAREAQRAGLVRHVVPDSEVEAAALELARKMARHSGAALRLAKKALSVGAAARHAALADAGRVYVDELMATEDALEGLLSFVEKRRPVWRHQ